MAGYHFLMSHSLKAARYIHDIMTILAYYLHCQDLQQKQLLPADSACFAVLGKTYFWDVLIIRTVLTDAKFLILYQVRNTAIHIDLPPTLSNRTVPLSITIIYYTIIVLEHSTCEEIKRVKQSGGNTSSRDKVFCIMFFHLISMPEHTLLYIESMILCLRFSYQRLN